MDTNNRSLFRCVGKKACLIWPGNNCAREPPGLRCQRVINPQRVSLEVEDDFEGSGRKDAFFQLRGIEAVISPDVIDKRPKRKRWPVRAKKHTFLMHPDSTSGGQSFAWLLLT